MEGYKEIIYPAIFYPTCPKRVSWTATFPDFTDPSFPDIEETTLKKAINKAGFVLQQYVADNQLHKKGYLPFSTLGYAGSFHAGFVFNIRIKI
ncbi:hypothetical protein UFOVP571_36 [uncultured Caudovirales phage]|uniref:Uncharacterized protein n=1 Tax=uncultured Caudovirales phage TaxID=2100421 RepID=A0A6J5MWY5_9CAUD|nr:hypothetical protein UFOVP571_36 [uncultured Caudovirales phage]